MSASSDVLALVHVLLQCAFIGVTLLLLLVTVVNRMRIRHVLLAWRRGPLKGVPAGPTAFLIALVVLVIGTYAAGHALPADLVAGYVVGAGFWFAAGLLSSSVLVTEYGFIQDINRTEQAVAWAQVVDYFETERNGKHRYVFFYLDSCDTRHRVELLVPASRSQAFRQVVCDKLHKRFDLATQEVYGKKAFKG